MIKHLAICKICRFVLSVPEGTVQTLIRHQQSHAKHKTPAVSGQGILTGYFSKNRVSPAIRDSTSKACLLMIAKDLQPFTVVEDVGFRSLAQHFINLGARCGKVDVNDILYDRTTLAKNHLPKVYDDCVSSVRNELSKVPYVSVTTATSTSSERVFSVCGAVFTERRCRLTAANLEKLVFLKYNMQE